LVVESLSDSLIDPGVAGLLHRGETLGGAHSPLQHHHESFDRFRGEGWKKSWKNRMEKYWEKYWEKCIFKGKN